MANRTAVVILNYNGKKFLQMFLANVVALSPEADVVVADNQSTDGSVEYLRSDHPDVKLVILDRNYGFTGGYNRVIKNLDYEYAVLLNSDIEVTPNWMEPIINFMDQHPQVGACQPKVLDHHQKDQFEYAGAAGGFLDTFGFPYCRGRIFDTLEKDTGQYNDNLEIFWATGAAMFIRTELYNRAGGLEEGFFAHMEEIDLCWRLQWMGQKVYCIPESTVYHVGGGTLSKNNAQKTYFNFRNNLAMILKNESISDLIWKLPFKLLLDWLAAFRFWSDNSIEHFYAVVKAHWHFLGQFRIYWKKRAEVNQLKTKSKLTSHRFIIWDYFIKNRKKFSAL